MPKTFDSTAAHGIVSYMIARTVHEPKPMTFHQERLIYGTGSLLCWALLQIATLFSPQDVRWLLVTAASSIMMALTLSLIFKGPETTIQLVVGRGMFSVLSGILLTKYFVYFFVVDSAHTDVNTLAACASACCIFGFIVGFAMLQYLMKNSEFFAKRLVDSKAKVFLPEMEPNPAETPGTTNTSNPPP